MLRSLVRWEKNEFLYRSVWFVEKLSHGSENKARESMFGLLPFVSHVNMF